MPGLAQAFKAEMDQPVSLAKTFADEMGGGANNNLASAFKTEMDGGFTDYAGFDPANQPPMTPGGTADTGGFHPTFPTSTLENLPSAIADEVSTPGNVALAKRTGLGVLHNVMRLNKIMPYAGDWSAETDEKLRSEIAGLEPEAQKANWLARQAADLTVGLADPLNIALGIPAEWAAAKTVGKPVLAALEKYAGPGLKNLLARAGVKFGKGTVAGTIFGAERVPTEALLAEPGHRAEAAIEAAKQIPEMAGTVGLLHAGGAPLTLKGTPGFQKDIADAAAKKFFAESPIGTDKPNRIIYDYPDRVVEVRPKTEPVAELPEGLSTPAGPKFGAGEVVAWEGKTGNKLSGVVEQSQESYTNTGGKSYQYVLARGKNKFAVSEGRLTPVPDAKIEGELAGMGQEAASSQHPVASSTEIKPVASALDLARERVRVIERKRNYDLADKGKKKLSKNDKRMIEEVKAADNDYQEAIRQVNVLEAQAKKVETRQNIVENKAVREQKIKDAESGKIDKNNLGFAPLDTLPEPVRTAIQDHARLLQGQYKPSSPQYRTLQRVIDDAGKDNTAGAIEAKIRIIDDLSGDKRKRLTNAANASRRKSGMPNVIMERMASQSHTGDPLIELYTGKDAPARAKEAIASIDAGTPDDYAGRLIAEIKQRIQFGEEFGVKAANADAGLPVEVAPEIARKWLGQIAGIKEIASSKKPVGIKSPEIPARPKDLLGREVIAPITGEQKGLGFEKSTTGDAPTPSGWVGKEGKLTQEFKPGEKPSDVQGQKSWWDTKVEEAHKRQDARNKGQQMYSGIPLDAINDAIIIGANWMKRGIVDKAKWAKAVIDKFGEDFKDAKLLDKLYDLSRTIHRDYLNEGRLKKMKDRGGDVPNFLEDLDMDPILTEPLITSKLRDRKIDKSPTGWQKELANWREINPTLRLRQKENAQKVAQLSPEFKGIGGFSAAFQDPMRVFKQVSGKHWETVRKLIIEPFDLMKREYILDKRRELKELDSYIVKKLGIEPGSAESAAVQTFGEGRGTYDGLVKKFGKEKASNIQKADNWFREKYDRMIGEMNAKLKEMYPSQPDKLIGKRKDYYRHFQDIQESLINPLKNAFDSPGDIPPSMALMSEYTKPRRKWQSIFARRTTEQTAEDAVGGFANYVPQWAYTKNVSPPIGQFRELGRAIAAKMEETGDSRNNVFLKWLDEYANNLSGKTSSFDRSLENLLTSKRGDRTYSRALTAINNRVRTNTIVGNMSSISSQLANIPTGLSRAGYLNSAKGAARRIEELFGKTPEMDKSSFMLERLARDETKFDRGVLKKTKNFLGFLLESADELGAKFTWNAMHEKGKSLGLKDAYLIRYADEQTRSIVGGRGIGERSALQNSKTFQLVAPFQLEVVNNWLVQKDMISEKAYGQLIKLAISTYIFNRVQEAITGQTTLFDPVDALIKGVKDMKREGLFKGGGNLIARLAWEAGSNIPVVNDLLNQITQKYGSRSRLGFGVLGDVAGGAIRTYQKLKEGDLVGAGKEAIRPASKLLPPFGGNQLYKTGTGLYDYIQGRETDKKGMTKWQVDQTPKNLVQSILFGKYATPAAREYIEKKEEKTPSGGPRAGRSIRRR